MTLPPPDSGALSRQALRRTFGAFPTGVTLVAAVVDGRAVGLLASSFTSVSLEPPLVSINVGRSSGTWPLLRQAPEWGITVPSAAVTQRLAETAARRVRGWIRSG